ncbi:MAG: hypothetical protein AAF196_14735 [Planctomycetota bacterium]
MEIRLSSALVIPPAFLVVVIAHEAIWEKSLEAHQVAGLMFVWLLVAMLPAAALGYSHAILRARTAKRARNYRRTARWFIGLAAVLGLPMGLFLFASIGLSAL